jgi:RNA polymerase sigma-70 factor (ECF subfamily)
MSGLVLSSVEKAVSTLPPNEKTAVILRHFDERSYDEIAGLMDCPVGTIKTYLYRGRRMLRDRLIKEGLWEV